MEGYKKCWIKDVENFDRVRILGTVLKKFKKSDDYGYVLIDDGSDIRVKFFGNTNLIDEIEVGDIVEIFGRVRKKGDEVFIIPDKIFKRDIFWELFRIIELSEIRIEGKEEKKMGIEEIISRILEILKEKEGFSIEEIYSEFKGSEDNVYHAIEKLKEEGIIFEERPGFYRRLM